MLGKPIVRVQIPQHKWHVNEEGTVVKSSELQTDPYGREMCGGVIEENYYDILGYNYNPEHYNEISGRSTRKKEFMAAVNWTSK